MKIYSPIQEKYFQPDPPLFDLLNQNPIPEIKNWLMYYQIMPCSELYEVRWGNEDKNALALARQGYRVTSFKFSQNHTLEKICGLSRGKNIGSGKFAYSIGTLQKLTDEETRSRYLKSLWNLLAPGGKLLLVNAGNGFTETVREPDPLYSMVGHRPPSPWSLVKWDTHRDELSQAGFVIQRAMVTINPEYNQCMTVYLSKGV